MLSSISISGILSFGWEPVTLTMRPLNVLIGPNTSGKSNLLDVLDFVRSIPSQKTNDVVQRRGGVEGWIHQGAGTGRMGIDMDIAAPRISPLRCSTTWRNEEDAIKLAGCRLIYPGQEGHSMLISPVGHPVASRFGGIQIYPARSPSRLGWDPGAIRRSGSNIFPALEKICDDARGRERLVTALTALHSGVDVEMGTEGFGLREGSVKVSLGMMSDGTLRWLCLLAVLLDPTPPPLICLEEPDAGLHPDLIHTLAELLRSASTQTQVILTTHNVQLVSEFTETPEDVVVCERNWGTTSLRRLDRGDLSAWLDGHSLGHVWMSGGIGGTRW